MECQSHFATNGSVRLHYVVAGDGPTVFFLHGIPDFWNGWRYQIRHLINSHRVVAMDLRGFNKSGKPNGLSSYAIPELVHDVIAVIRDLGENRVALVGHDWGGIIAWWTAILFPQFVRSLFIISAPHPLCYLAALADGSQSSYARYIEGLLSAPPDAPLDLDRWSEWVKDPVAKQELKAALARSNPESIRNYYRANILGANRLDISRIPNVTAPAFVMYGDSDPYTTPAAYAGTGAFVTGELHFSCLRDHAHFLHHDAAQQVNEELVRWLESTKP